MTQKIISMFAFLALVFLSLGFVSATNCIVITPVSIPTNITHDQGQIAFSYNASYKTACSTDRTNVTITYTSNKEGDFSDLPSVFNLSEGESKLIQSTFTMDTQQSGDLIITVNYNTAEDGTNSADLSAINILDDAELSISVEKALTNTQNGTIKITNTGNVNLLSIDLSQSGDFNVDLSKTTISLLAPGASDSVDVSLTNPDSIEIGSNSVVITATASDSTTNSITLPLSGTFCEFGQVGDLTIRKFNIDNLGDGKDEDWYPLDEIEMEVEVKNEGSERVRDIVVDVLVLDSDGNDVTSDFDFDDDSLRIGSLSDGDRDSVTFRIDSVPADMDEGDYTIYVKAYDDNDEELNCKEDSQKVSITKENNEAVVIRNLQGSYSANPEDIVTVSFDVYNVGSDDEEDVLVQLVSPDLGVDKREHLRNFDVGDKKTISFDFMVPKDASPKDYDLRVFTYFNYDDGDVLEPISYDESSYNDLDEDYISVLTVEGTPASSEPTVTARLTSGAMVGENLVVEFTVENNEDDTVIFVVSPTNYESWAELVDVSPQLLTIKAGENAKSSVTLKPTKAGTYTFNLQTIYNGKTSEQQVSVTVGGEEETTQPGFFDNLFSGMDSAVVYAIVAVLVILIIVVIVLIIVVAARKPKHAEF